MTQAHAPADDALWGGAGSLAALLPGWRARPGQRQLAEAVEQTIDARGILLAEAGTGTGKTLAYLIPALERGERLIVSTATRALQDQLHAKDLPLAAEALGLHPRVAVLKGRANYICPHRLHQTQQQGLLESRAALQQLRRIALYAASSSDGDLAGVGGLDERSSLIPLVTSSRDNCLGADCPEFRACFVMKARREALAADVVVINHHLFFANLALRDEGVAELLPTATTIVLDEAHQLPTIGAQFLGESLGSAQSVELARDLLGCGMSQARGLADWPELGAELQQSLRELRLCAPAGAQRMDWDSAQQLPGWADAVDGWERALAAIEAALQPVLPLAADFGRLHERTVQQQTLLRDWQQVLEPPQQEQADAAASSQERVRWLELSHHHLRLHATPLGIGAAFAGLVAQRPQAWILASATLTLDGSFRWARARFGLGEGSPALLDADGRARLRELRVASPFDYPARTRLLVPRSGFHPSDPDHALHVAELAAPLVAANPGGSFVLTTTLRAIERIATRLRELLPPGREVLQQGSEAKSVLLARFAADRSAVLVGSHSFWEGVDLPGEQLTLVVIDKLPFAPPDDPLVAARLKRLEQAGRSGFADYSLPQAALALQQGAGRLLRSESDWGVLVVCDQRLVATGWGRRLLSALPAFTRVDNATAALEFLARRGQD